MSRYGLGTFLRHFFNSGGGPEKVLRYNLAPALITPTMLLSALPCPPAPVVLNVRYVRVRDVRTCTGTRAAWLLVKNHVIALPSSRYFYCKILRVKCKIALGFTFYFYCKFYCKCKSNVKYTILL